MFTSHFLGGLGSVRQWQQWLLPPASSFSALPSSPDPLRPTPRRVPMVAKRKPRRFSSMALFREYDINTHAVTARTKFQTLKLQKKKKHLTTAHWGGGVFFPTLMADTALKEAVVWLFDRGSIVSRFDVIRQMWLILVTFLTKVALMSLLLVWRGLCALIL